MATLIIGGALTALGGLGGTLLGFGTSGIVAGSAAAAAQAAIGNVAAGSVFATLTSWGMTGVFTTAAYAGGAAAAVGALVEGSSDSKEGEKDIEWTI